MSSTSSMPIETRTSSGPTPAARSSSSVSCWWVVEAGWMISDFASPTLARCENSSTDSMSRRPASRPPSIPKVKIEPGALRQVLALPDRGSWFDGQAGVVDVARPPVLRQELRHPLRVVRRAGPSGRQRLKALQQQPGGERRHRRAVVAQHLRPALHQPAEVTEVLEEAEVVVALGRLGHAGELAVVPREAPASTITPPIAVPCPQMNFVAEWTTMSAPHSSGRHRYGDAKVLSTISGTPDLVGERRDRLDVEHVDRRVADRLGVERLGLRGHRRPPLLEVRAVDEAASIPTLRKLTSNCW